MARIDKLKEEIGWLKVINELDGMGYCGCVYYFSRWSGYNRRHRYKTRQKKLNLFTRGKIDKYDLFKLYLRSTACL